MAGTKINEFKDMLPVVADKLGGDGLIRELCNRFRLLMDKDEGLITIESLKKNLTLLGLQDLSDDELLSMVKDGDLNGDGALDQMEFCVLMFRLSPELIQGSQAWLEHAPTRAQNYYCCCCRGLVQWEVNNEDPNKARD